MLEPHFISSFCEGTKVPKVVMVEKGLTQYGGQMEDTVCIQHIINSWLPNKVAAYNFI